MIFVLPAGAFLTLGMLLALIQWMRARAQKRRAAAAEAENIAPTQEKTEQEGERI